MLKLPVIVTGFFGLVYVHAACTQITVSSRSLELYVGLYIFFVGGGGGC